MPFPCNICLNLWGGQSEEDNKDKGEVSVLCEGDAFLAVQAGLDRLPAQHDIDPGKLAHLPQELQEAHAAKPILHMGHVMSFALGLRYFGQHADWTFLRNSLQMQGNACDAS